MPENTIRLSAIDVDAFVAEINSNENLKAEEIWARRGVDFAIVYSNGRYTEQILTDDGWMKWSAPARKIHWGVMAIVIKYLTNDYRIVPVETTGAIERVCDFADQLSSLSGTDYTIYPEGRDLFEDLQRVRSLIGEKKNVS